MQRCHPASCSGTAATAVAATEAAAVTPAASAAVIQEAPITGEAFPPPQLPFFWKSIRES
jgi:hypothetical protein